MNRKKKGSRNTYERVEGVEKQYPNERFFQIPVASFGKIFTSRLFENPPFLLFFEFSKLLKSTAMNIEFDIPKKVAASLGSPRTTNSTALMASLASSILPAPSCSMTSFSSSTALTFSVAHSCSTSWNSSNSTDSSSL